MRGITPENADHYIAMQTPEMRQMLEKLRSIIKSAAPHAVETISYGVPCFSDHYMLVGMGATKKHCSFYTMNPGLVKQMRDELEGIKYSGSTLHFEPGEPLPKALIKKIVQFRMEENETRAEMKKKK